MSLEKVAECLPELAAGSELLEIGGGDGALLNAILRRFPAVRPTMIDLAPAIGSMLDPDLRPRVRILPETSIAAYQRTMTRPPDTVLIGDVVHHVPATARPSFFADIRNLLAGRTAKLIVKDIEPGHFISHLSYLADRYVSGDRQVALVSRDEMVRLIRASFGEVAIAETALYEVNPPNYCLVISCDAVPPTQRKFPA